MVAAGGGDNVAVSGNLPREAGNWAGHWQLKRVSASVYRTSTTKRSLLTLVYLREDHHAWETSGGLGQLFRSGLKG